MTDERTSTSRRRAGGPGEADREATRARLVAAGLDLFGRQGYEGATTRAIAAAAGVNLASIPYHFGGKEGLYVAVAKHVADEIGQRMLPAFAEVEAVLADPQAPRAAVLAQLHALMDRFCDLLVGGTQAAPWARFIIREQMDPSPAFDIFYEGVMRIGHSALCRLVGRLAGLPADAEETKIRAFALIGQVLVFRVAHAGVLRRLGWEEITPERLAATKAAVNAHIAAIFSDGSAGP